jgi:hypothetical protein
MQLYRDILQRLEILNTNSTQKIFSSSDVFNDLDIKAMNFCGAIRPNQKVMPSDFRRKLRLKGGDTDTKVKGDMAAAVV